MSNTASVIAPASRAERQRLQLRQEIIDAAFMEFSERGYHQTGISHIAKRLGIGHGTFYRYFENKRDILEHVIDSVCDKIRLAMAEANAPTASRTLEDYEAQLARLGVSLSKILHETPGLFRILLLEATSIDPEMTRRITDFFDWCARQVDAYFENGMRQGFLRSDLDRQATAHVLVGMIFSTILMTINGGEPELLKRMNSAVRRMLLDGIASRPDFQNRSESQ
ncbi:MAG: TetR/AcrR family transcriptional regulator [bacterium]